MERFYTLARILDMFLYYGVYFLEIVLTLIYLLILKGILNNFG